LFAGLFLAGVSLPRAASACGGTFCDNGPRPMPVDQTGENIAFVMLPGMVEAHIQIQYKGEASKFSWVVPVQALPEVEVGSQGLFDKLLRSTVPTYSFTTQRDFCGGVGTGTSGFAAGAGGSFGGFPADASAASDGGVVVLSQKPVGAFEVTVLGGGTTAEVVTWLTDNQYAVPTNAAALLDGYVANHFLFVAVKLTGGAGIDEIHPLVVRYPGTNPCVPIKLTSVAAVNDMGIRTFFLGGHRVVPKNYKHLVPNLAKFDWFNAATTYNDFISRAIDSPVANGKAWVTEYAGPTSIAAGPAIASSSWNATPFKTSQVVGVVQLLQSQNLMSCFGSICNYNHPLLLPLLRQYVPAPASLTVNGQNITDPNAVEGYFYTCLGCYQDKIDVSKWDPMAFASDLAARVIDPSRHADDLLKTWPYLTRMFTTLSPVEMDLDPEFFERDGLDNVPRINLNAVQRITCTQQAAMTLPDGRAVALPSQGTWPTFSNQMPFAEKIDEIQPNAVVNLVDNTATIDAQLKAWNDAQGWPPALTTTGPGPVVGSGGYGPGSSGPGSTGPGSGGQGGAGEAGSSGASVTADGKGCACTAAASSSRAGGHWVFAALLGLAARYRRRRAQA
jgi:MYXO-CTERM domain-containing protein